RLSRHPPRVARCARHARDDLRLESRDADARRSGAAAHPRGACRTSTPLGRRFQGIRYRHRDGESRAAHRPHFRARGLRPPAAQSFHQDAGSSRRGKFMTPNPFSDALHFLAKPAWPTAIYWLLLLGSIAIAIYAWRSIASQRSWRNVADWLCRFFVGTM